jgi:hypothetical protein
MTREEWFHLVEILILLFGVAAPILYTAIRLHSLMKDFPMHKHVNGKVLYPKGYEPTRVETLEIGH